MKHLLLYLLILVFMSNAQAEWFETQGQAIVINNNVQQAKTEATQNALKKALLVAGANVSSVRQVVNGLLTEDNLNIRASGNVQSLEVLSESHSGNLMTVVIRADIFPQLRQCFSASYRKPVVVTRSHIKHREQANIGGIYDIDLSLTQLLSNHIKNNNQYSDSTVTLNKATGFSRINGSIYTNKLKVLSTTIAGMSDTQHVIFLEINDLSIDSNSLNQWQFWQDDKFNRQFSFTLYLYNGVNGEKIMEKSYSAFAPWQFEKKRQVDVNSHLFWQSDYGLMVKNLVDSAASDVDEHLMCEPTRAKILSIDGSEVTFNMGQDSGVKIGDEFSLMHIENKVADDGKIQKAYLVSPYKVKVNHVSTQFAKATSVDKVLGNIQVNDIAVRY